MGLNWCPLLGVDRSDPSFLGSRCGGDERDAIFFVLLLARRQSRRFAVVVGDTGDVLVRERKHLRQQVVFVEVFQVVYLVERALVLLGRLLDLIEDFFIFRKTHPEFVEVVLILFVKRRRV